VHLKDVSLSAHRHAACKPFPRQPKQCNEAVDLHDKQVHMREIIRVCYGWLVSLSV
jgi:hypothetical protein